MKNKHYRDGLYHPDPVRVEYLDMGAVAETFGDGAIFVTTTDGVGAHGDTIPDALLAAKWKLLDRGKIAEEISKKAKENGGEKYLFSVEEFRACTGACKAGTKLFLSQRNIPENHKATLEEVEKLTPVWGKAFRSALKW